MSAAPAPEVGDVPALLRQSEVFGRLDDGVRQRLAEAWTHVHVPGGEVFIHAGDPGDAVYLVVSGRLQVLVARGGDATIVAELGRGDVVGEMSLIDDSPRHATVRTVRDSHLLRLGVEHFRELIEQEPAVLLAISRVLVQRLRVVSSETPSRTTTRTLALVPAQPSLPVLEVARYLASTPGSGPVAVVDASVAASREDATEAQLLTWLQQLELDHRLVLYVADAGDEVWTRRCLRQADRAVVVVDADDDPVTGSAAHATVRAVAPHVPVDLLLLHPSARVQPRGTSRWLHDDLATHHHVRRGRPADHARVARLLTGRGVGLTLGGGGPRGFAHVGVLRAFDDVGLPVDAVGGTSIGAIMAGFVGLGWDQSTLEAKVHEAFVTSGKVVDRTLPLVSLASARRLESLLHDDRFFGDTAVEDLWVPWFAISTNLSRADVVVHDRGPAWRAIRASISLPGVFPPVWHHGDVLVDGGVLNNLPLDVMADRLGGGVHVAVDLEPPVDLRIPTAFPSAISGWQVALRRLRGSPSTARIPGPLEVLLRSRGVGSRSALRSVRTDVEVDLMLSPPVDGYGPLDFTVAAELIERGHRYTLERLADVDGRVRALLSEAAR